MTAQPISHRLDSRRLGVPGAELYYEVRGAGPLLLVVGQPMTSGPFGPLADLLAADHTVVTYDPRGVGASTVTDATQDITPEVEADDLAAIIDAVGGGPADVFGTSGGAVAGLALLVRHPDAVGTLVAHEPPVAELLPDAAAIRAAVDDVQQAYRTSGSGAAWPKFVALVMHDGVVGEGGVPPVAWPPQGAPGDPEAAHGDQGSDERSDGEGAGHGAGEEPSAEQQAKQQADDAVFFLRMLVPFTRWLPPVDALRPHLPRVVFAVGEASREEVAARSSVALADLLGVATTPFPGGHGGFMGDPAPFADAVRGALRRTS